MKDTARIILTTEYVRDCKYCVNRYPGMLESAKPFRFMHEMLMGLKPYKAVCLTGGEPMVFMPEETIAFAEAIKYVFPDKKVYTYVADYRCLEEMARLMAVADGIHYTLHASADEDDLNRFHVFQALAAHIKGSYRLYINPEMAGHVTVVPDVWSRVELKPWLGPDECKLPDNEDLYIWRKQ